MRIKVCEMQLCGFSCVFKWKCTLIKFYFLWKPTAKRVLLLRTSRQGEAWMDLNWKILSEYIVVSIFFGNPEGCQHIASFVCVLFCVYVFDRNWSQRIIKPLLFCTLQYILMLTGLLKLHNWTDFNCRNWYLQTN